MSVYISKDLKKLTFLNSFGGKCKKKNVKDSTLNLFLDS